MTGKGYNSCYLNGTLVTNPDEKVEVRYLIYFNEFFDQNTILDCNGHRE